MKLMRFIPVMMIFLAFSCMAQKSEKIFDSIEYSAYTRGTNINIKVNNDKVIYKGNYGDKEVVLTDDEKNKLNEIIKGLDLSRMPSLKAPSEKRISDGALHGEFSIKVGDVSYKSSIFDAGNAPKELKPLEDYLNALIGAVD